MQTNQAWVVAPRGYVRACFSKRLKGHALPLELVRRHLGAVNESGFRRRLRREFEGYLVTDAPEVWRDDAGRVVVICGDLFAGGDLTVGRVLRSGFCPGWLDAPDYLAAGGCGQYLAVDKPELCAVQRMVVRGGVLS